MMDANGLVWPTLWRSGRILADAVQRAGPAKADVALDADHALDWRQRAGQRATVRSAFCSPGHLLGLLQLEPTVARGQGLCQTVIQWAKA
ncbi:hypothetical protein FBQ73_08550 [Xanthobacter autotrophicus]|uniref:Uncharacterized protein n=1 Tax=Xanthobacter autotrophicus TaxID=280 RepID=A0A6C1KSU1_XANAU|nr:hypothetical protein FBQ73_08550 [Xanthobacter autotrophicus]